MPLYEYRCCKCDEQFEVRQAMGEDGSSLRCPRCNAAKPTKLISTFCNPGAGNSLSIGDCCTTPSPDT